jgi:asparagine synthetase B (glutamine-hydrolysing)
MSHAGGSVPIELPHWYARVATNGSRDDPGRDSTAGETVHIGPLTVFRPGRGCEVAAFGRAENPSAVVFDGYLFDRTQLTTELGLTASVSTPDLVAAAYQTWGADIFERLDGCYLIAIWDGSLRRLLIGHDALGRHPVFYATPPGAVWFCSNILALASSGRISKRPNRLSLALAVLAWWPEAGQTFFEAVSRLRPGHYLEVNDSSAIAERKYWDPMPEDDEPWLPDDQVLEEFEPALKRAVDRCMDLGAQGIMLSGGVDSVTVAALASSYWKAHHIPPLVAVSGRTGQAPGYEELMQSRVTEVLTMPHLVTTTPEWTGGRDEIELSLDVTSALPSPSRIYWVGGYTHFYRWTAARRVNTLLTGAGGDNWLGVAESYAADLIGRLQLVQLLRFMKADMGTGGSSARNSARRLLWAGGVRPHVDTLWTRLAPARKARYHRRKWEERLPAWICPDKALREELVCRLLGRRTPGLTRSGAAPRSYYRQGVRAASNPYMHYENEVAYHIETDCGLRLLSPYHDRTLVSFFNRIPPRVLVYGDRYKGLLRPIVAKHLPGLGLESQRKLYPREQEERNLRDLRQSIASGWADARFDTLGHLGVVGPEAKQAFGAAVDKGYNALVQMFIMMSAELWTRVHTDA